MPSYTSPTLLATRSRQLRLDITIISADKIIFLKHHKVVTSKALVAVELVGKMPCWTESSKPRCKDCQSGRFKNCLRQGVPDGGRNNNENCIGWSQVITYGWCSSGTVTKCMLCTHSSSLSMILYIILHYWSKGSPFLKKIWICNNALIQSIVMLFIHLCFLVMCVLCLYDMCFLFPH